MKLVKQGGSGWQYWLNQDEANMLRVLVRQFPVTAISPVKITKTDPDPKAAEREQLLNESLAELRAELKLKAGKLVGEDRFKASDGGQIFRIGAEERETMLQILNDIRIESWHVLGDPEEIEMDQAGMSRETLKHYHFMHLAGYFEHHFLNLEEPKK
jgi:hypothetical protein